MPSSMTRLSRSGFSATGPAGVQFRVFGDERCAFQVGSVDSTIGFGAEGRGQMLCIPYWCEVARNEQRAFFEFRSDWVSPRFQGSWSAANFSYGTAHLFTCETLPVATRRILASIRRGVHTNCVGGSLTPGSLPSASDAASVVFYRSGRDPEGRSLRAVKNWLCLGHRLILTVGTR